ncbi:MAG: PSD1 and planctomycete cytochrome C domain-containing protein [Bacteroidetes bacterium]|nr:PSD1 and planctomycete cytochrome C domain-containing protein [Bacteroidota bacterium]
MNRFITGYILIAAAMLMFVGCSRAPEVSFNEQIRPILNERCVNCHGGIRRQGDLSLLFRHEALAAAESGERAVVPLKPAESELLRRVSHTDPKHRMPQDDDPLTPEQIQTLHTWIAEGAQWEDHWAYVTPERPALPGVSDPAWPSEPLDHFILSRLDEEGLSPSPEAECPVLVRRVTLDLVGLPPKPEDVRQICVDGGSYETYVDSLQASPTYGERWAAMWLDLARYADSKGYEKDIGRTIWRYRDWVIQALNDDLPFDQFTIEQLAGDLLPNATESQRIATAFNRNTMTNTEGGTDDEEFRVAAVIDRVNTTWEVWQGTSFACVQCHGHPYDPFTHEEYYEFFTFFNSTADRDLDSEYPTLPLFEEEVADEGSELIEDIAQLEEDIIARVRSHALAEERRAWETTLDQPEIIGRVRLMLQNEVKRVVATPEEQRGDGQQRTLDHIYASVSDDPQLERLRSEKVEKEQVLRTLNAVHTPIMQELPFRRRTHVFERGSFLLKGEPVEPNTPNALPPMPEDAPRNRLGMARWLVSRENPLTARVTVNRFWEQLFGIGLIESLEDFGTQGLERSHPDLLDYLAVSFMEDHSWSVKSFLRSVVISSTYRQSSRVTGELEAKDPRNRLLARGARFRLSAEQIRDQALYVSGLLSPAMFGPSVMPPQPEGLWNNPYDARRWQTSQGNDRYRRGIYTYWRRTVPYPSMATFDSPSREFCVSRRIRTNTPLQALVSLNDPVFIEAAQALAQRMLDSENPLEAGYTYAIGVAPDEKVLDTLGSLYNDAMTHYTEHDDDVTTLTGDQGSAELAGLTVVANAILNLDQFIMKE